jgi:hypothetical protein
MSTEPHLGSRSCHIDLKLCTSLVLVPLGHFPELPIANTKNSIQIDGFGEMV